MKNKIWELIDYLLDCCEYPLPNEFNKLPTIEGQDLRDYAKKELNNIFEKDKDEK
jgi:hypothetical protein